MITARVQGRIGRMTLDRPEALNALTHQACHEVSNALRDWASNDQIAMVVINAAGDKAFCAGGDISQMYATGIAGDFDYGRAFWRDEYRMNAQLFRFPKPVATFLQGLTLGGGVGVGCHGSHRIVCENSKIALPETSIGLVPDVGSTLLCAQAPGRLGAYLGLTGDKMDASDAIHCGFADYFIPQDKWPDLIDTLAETGDWASIDAAAQPAPASRLARWQADIDAVFGGEKLGDIYRGIPTPPSEAITHALKLMSRNAPLSMATALEIIHRVQIRPRIETALDHEYRFNFRVMEHGDFLEGIRAAIIDKDRNPQWKHRDWQDVSGADVLRMTLPLGKDSLTFEDAT